MPLTRTDLLWKLAVPVLGVAAGVAIGWVGRDRLMREEDRRDFSEVREDGYEFISPLLECDTDRDEIRNRELRPFREKVEAYLRHPARREGVGTLSLYFRELNDGPWFAIDEGTKYSPASMRKVPMLIAVLKQSERTPDLLTRGITSSLKQDHSARQNFKPSQTLEPGRTYAVGDLLARMIVQSDNNAFMLVSGIVDPDELEKVYELLSLRAPSATRDDARQSVHTYASFFRILYNATYLSKERSDQALQLLSGVEFRSGIVAGVPKEVVVAHKFGEHSDDRSGEKQLHDCGIVYYPRHPYLLCVMTRGSGFEPLGDVIASISRLIYAEVDAQHRSGH